jgi:hypothetical protein
MNRVDPKWELIRRLRYGALLKLFRRRWGHELPDDDAGRDDLWLLVSNVSLAAAEPEKKMRHVIEMWAPWMSAEEQEDYVRHVWGLDLYERTQTAQEIGRRLGLTNAEREALKLWPFRPIDMTSEELAEQAKVRKRERQTRKRRERGVRTQEEYLQQARRPKPWIAEGVSSRTWYRRRKAVALGVKYEQRSVALGVKQTIVTKVASDPVPSERRHASKEGLQEGAWMEGSAETTKNRAAEVIASCSPDLASHRVPTPEPVPDHATPASSPEVPQDPRLAAMLKWGVNAQGGAQVGEVITNPVVKKRWAKPAIVADEPRDFDEFPLKETDVA